MIFSHFKVMASCNLKFPIEAFNKEKKKSQLLLVDQIYFDNSTTVAWELLGSLWNTSFFFFLTT